MGVQRSFIYDIHAVIGLVCMWEWRDKFDQLGVCDYELAAVYLIIILIDEEPLKFSGQSWHMRVSTERDDIYVYLI